MRLIDADAIIEFIDLGHYRNPLELCYSERDVVDMIESRPTAERKHGEWIFNPSDAIEAMFTKPKCSECGFESADGGNYCPNCGADMRGEE